MTLLDAKWARTLLSFPETGMGYIVCRVSLSDGRVFDRVVIVEGAITRCDGSDIIPFAAHDVIDIVPTHDKSAF